jgi:hypothetical protein
LKPHDVFLSLITALALALACGDDVGDEAGPRGVPDAAVDDASTLDQLAADTGNDSGEEVDAGAEDVALEDGAADAAPDQTAVDAGSCTIQETLLDLTGQTFTPTASNWFQKHPFGVKGTTYCSLNIQLDLQSAELLPVNTDAGMVRLEHIFFGLSRANQIQSSQRYLMGTAAVRFTNKSPTLKMYGRKALANGSSNYTAWQVSNAWKTDTSYHIDCTFDAVLKQQTCKLFSSGVLLKQVVGAIAYIDAALHMSSAFALELGCQPGGPELTTPLGWQISNARVTATR